MKTSFCFKATILLFLLLLVKCGYSKPQQDQSNQLPGQMSEPNVQNVINQIFTSSSAPIETTSPHGFNLIVMPASTVTLAPQATTASDAPCTCIPYFLCDQSNNTITDEDDARFGTYVITVRFSDCDGSLDVCCKMESIKNLTVIPSASASPSASTSPSSSSSQPTVFNRNRPSGCGLRNVGGLDFQIIGAPSNDADFGEFPWTIALIRIDNNSNICGGSLIHPKAVLTGFHCVKDYIFRPLDLKARAGEWDIQTTNERLAYQERIALRIFGHSRYNPRSLANDFAIIELIEEFKLDIHINTVCLPPPEYIANSPDCFASGWGKDVIGNNGKYSAVMKKVPLPIVSFNNCQTKLQTTQLTDKFRLDPSFICAGGVPGVDTCQGDGGAPLVCPVGNPKENRYCQSGIVAWGIGCKESHPAVYANVALARDWIDLQMAFIGLNSSYYTY